MYKKGIENDFTYEEKEKFLSKKGYVKHNYSYTLPVLEGDGENFHTSYYPKSITYYAKLDENTSDWEMWKMESNSLNHIFNSLLKDTIKNLILNNI